MDRTDFILLFVSIIVFLSKGSQVDYTVPGTCTGGVYLPTVALLATVFEPA